jgi:hypothetical protein
MERKRDWQRVASMVTHSVRLLERLKDKQKDVLMVYVWG